MKKLLKGILVATAAILFFAGCSGIALTDAKVQDSNSNEKCVLTISVKDFDKLNVASAGSRAINPVDFENDTDVTIGSFKLTGNSQLSGTTYNELITFNSSKKGTITLEKDVWYLTLTAYSDAAATAGKELLQGKVRVDLSKSNSIEFTLTTDGVTTPGSVNLKGTVSDAEKLIKSYKAGLYTLDDNKLIGSEKTEEYTGTALTETTKEFTFASASVNPGQYAFKVIFYNAESKPIGVWADEIVVAPGRETKDISLALPAVIMDPPTAPDNLKVYYKDNSDANGYYIVKLIWEDKSYNEENFVVSVLEYNSFATGATATSTKALGKDFYKDEMYAGGTLGVSQTSCELKLQAGKLYDFTVAAQNIVGTSTAVGRITSNPATDPDAATGYTIAAAGAKINRVKVTYELTGGTLKFSATDNTKIFTGNYVKYYTYAGSAFDLLTVDNSNYPTINTADPVVPTLAIINESEDDNLFNTWLDDSNAETTTYNSWKNLIVRADYNTNVSYTISDHYEEIAATATYPYDSVDTDCKNLEIDLTDAKTTPTITFTAAAPSGVTGTYDYIKVTLRTIGYERSYGADADTLDVNISSIPSGIYSVVVLAHKVGEHSDSLKSDSFTIKIKR